MSLMINLLDEIDKHVPDIQIQPFHLHEVDRIPHEVDRILHRAVVLPHGVVVLLHGAVRIFEFGNPLLKFRR